MRDIKKQQVVVLQPVTMRIPNKHGVYSPSKLLSQKKISYEEFHLRYANQRKAIRVCLDKAPSADTILQRSQVVTAYGYGLDCWYTIVAVNVNGNSTLDSYPHQEELWEA